MNKYQEICTRYQKIGTREFSTGQVVRTVAISDKDAAIMNGMVAEHGFKYVLIKAAEPTEKEIRKELFNKAVEMGLNPAKFIKTEELRKLINQ